MSAATVLTDDLLRRLEGAGVHSLEDWRRLGRRRHQIFDITRRVADQLDELARRRVKREGRPA
jgi:hypothetical protein